MLVCCQKPIPAQAMTVLSQKSVTSEAKQNPTLPAGTAVHERERGRCANDSFKIPEGQASDRPEELARASWGQHQPREASPMDSRGFIADTHQGGENEEANNADGGFKTPEVDQQQENNKVPMKVKHTETTNAMSREVLEQYLQTLQKEELQSLILRNHVHQKDDHTHWRIHAAVTECMLEPTLANEKILADELMRGYGHEGLLNFAQFTVMSKHEFGLQGENCRNLFDSVVGMDDDKETVALEELEALILKLCVNRHIIEHLRDAHLHRKNACTFSLFADKMIVSSPYEMQKLLRSMLVFTVGNVVLFFITSCLCVVYIVGPEFRDAAAKQNLSLSMYVVYSVIYLMYCVIFARFFSSDHWASVGLVLYTLGYLLITISLALDSVTQADEIEVLGLIGLACFVVGSVPFFLTSPSTGLKYNHERAAVRGGLKFFVGSILFMGSYARDLGDHFVHFVASFAYALFVWGRVEFVVAIFEDTGASAEALVSNLVCDDLKAGKGDKLNLAKLHGVSGAFKQALSRI